MDDLRGRYIKAKTAEERSAIEKEIKQLVDTDAMAVADIALEQAKEANKRADDHLRSRIESILPAVSMSYIAKTYFKKSRSWLMQRINGYMVNGTPAKFSDEELKTLNFALKDLSSKLAEVSVLR